MSTDKKRVRTNSIEGADCNPLSITSPTRASKRLRQTSDAQMTSSVASPETENALLRLPREVRDQTYSLALNNHGFTIQHRDLMLRGINGNGVFDRDTILTGGLPT
jgi:hypothetical protein